MREKERESERVRERLREGKRGSLLCTYLWCGSVGGDGDCLASVRLTGHGVGYDRLRLFGRLPVVRVIISNA